MDRSTLATSGCRVTGEELLPSEIGGASALCAAIRSARPASSDAVSVEVRVESPYRMAATQTLASGEALAEVRTARADRPLGRRSVQMLANALAAQLADIRK